MSDFICFCKKDEIDVVILVGKGKTVCSHVVAVLKPKELKAKIITL